MLVRIAPITSRFRDTKSSKSSKSEMHQMSLKWTWTLTNQRYNIYTKYLTQVPKLYSFRSTTNRFRDTRSSTRGTWALSLYLTTLTEVVNTLSCMTTNVSNNPPDHITSYKISLPIYVLLVSQLSNFSQLCSKASCYTCYTYMLPRGPKLHWFHSILRPVHRMTP